MKTPSCIKNIQWCALGENDKMAMDVLDDKVNWVTVMRVGGNNSVQHISETLNRDSCKQILWDKAREQELFSWHLIEDENSSIIFMQNNLIHL